MTLENELRFKNGDLAAEVLGAPILLDIDNSSQFVSSNAPLDKVNLHQAEIASTTRKLNLNFSSIDAENSTTPTLVVNAKDIGNNLTGTGQQYQIDNSSTVYSAIETKELALAEIRGQDFIFSKNT